MRKSKQETARTRRRIVNAAAVEFRRNGVVSTGLAELMSAAGLTHGGFYRHFESKEQLVAEACAAALDSTISRLENAASRRPKANGLRGLVTEYLCISHRDEPHDGCAVAALGSEIARADEGTRAVVTDRFLRLVGLVQNQLEGARQADARKQALVVASTMIGALMLSRIVTDSALSDSILRNTKECILKS